MPTRPDDFSPAVIRQLRDRVNGICSNPGCRRGTVGPSGSKPDKVVITGEAAHIKAAQPGGPRYDENQSPEERRSIENGLWLCGACADLIDKNGGADYPVKVLVAWKEQAEKATRLAQASPADHGERPWDSGFGGISYMNIPRLAMWGAGQGLKIDVSFLADVANLHDMGFDLTRLMYEIEQALKHLSFRAVPLEQAVELEQDFTGATVSFERQFFTKNGPHVPAKGQSVPISSDWKKAPQIHCKLGKWRVVVVYDPRWITTSTAYVEFAAGTRRFKGIGIVKEVNERDSLVFVSPLFIGFPKSPFDL